jgi:uncharacterized protein (TIGR02996 family)
MTTKTSFYQAIRQSPDDLPLRLVFADWLEEQGDPLGAFIRLQCQIESLREGGEEGIEELERQELEMIRQHQPAWLGPLHALEFNERFCVGYRRGLVESASMPLQTLLQYEDEMAQRCPVLHDVTLYAVREHGADLAQCKHLLAFDHVHIADWLTDNDGIALADSPHLAGLQTLTLWLGSRYDLAVLQALASSSHLANLKEFRLMQLYGGVVAENRAAELSARADALAAEVDQIAGRKLATIVRPFDRLFPLDGDLGYGLYAGRLPGDRQALAAIDYDRQILLIVFDAAGAVIEEIRRDLNDVLVRQPEHEWERYHEGEMLEYLNREFGFELSLIHVKEFAIFEGPCVCYIDSEADLIASPDDPPSWYRTEGWEPYSSILGFWAEGGNFLVGWGNNYWAGPDGKIHTS